MFSTQGSATASKYKAERDIAAFLLFESVSQYV
jgi:hypothetical protein